MRRNRKANLEVEYALERQIKELKEQNAKLKKLLREKEKTDKVEKVEVPKIKKSVEKECPSCGAKVKVSPIPIGILELCGSACGYRAVIKNKKED